MARLEECSRCDSYKAGICTKQWKEPSFNDTPCEMRTTPDINRENQASAIDDTNEEQPSRRIQKRGSSASGHNVKKVVSQREIQTEALKEESDSTIYVSDGTFRLLKLGWRILSICILLAVIVGCWYGWQYYQRQKKEAFKEDLVMEVKNILSPLVEDNTFRYMRLIHLTYEDNCLCFKYESNNDELSARLSVDKRLNQGEDSIKATDDTKRQFFLSTMAMRPHEWDTACQLLDSAGVDVKVSYIREDETCMIPHEQLQQISSSSAIFQKSEDIFIRNKKSEIFRYARKHFRRDRVFGVDSVSISPDFVTLHLNFNDNVILGKNHLDTAFINAHFTDPVGEMGSIADNMLTICSLTNCGIAFKYVGRKKHEVYRWEWDTNRTQAFLADYPGYIPYSQRKTNRVRSVIVKRRENNKENKENNVVGDSLRPR